jgi:thiosulfate dehydrogenase
VRWVAAALLLLAATPAMAAETQAAFMPPPDSAIPNDKFGEVIRLGENIFRDTDKYAPEFVGNQLRCSNCHLQAGRQADSAPMWAAYTMYPAYRSKDGEVNSFEERIRGCFRYSMNGKAPPLGSPTLIALESYAFFLAKGLPTGESVAGHGYPALAKPPQPPDYARGKEVYRYNCAQCHGASGQGQSSDGRVVFPPLWGANSYNWGAGIATVKTAAEFIHANMPLALAGSLSEQQAWDVAAFIDSQVRPQDPRFTGNVADTRKQFHDSPFSMYGQMVNGAVLGDPATTPAFGTMTPRDGH